MRVTKQRDTPAEVALRSKLHRGGFRFGVDKAIPGVTRARPDILFPTEKVAVFVDGCFWHSCPEHGTIPKANREWWIEKLAGNVERDRRHRRELGDAGWVVLRVWEHESASQAATQVASAVLQRRSET